ncbi:MAG: CRISPR-associated endonuclease Cas2 [Coleofasciculus sp. S288]|nr:CRISPR-associated endonuclease Cas2 [Coleofasciculus sp. S288]
MATVAPERLLIAELCFSPLQISIEKLIKPQEDSVRVYVLDAGAVKRTLTYGSEQPRQDKTIIL